MPQDLCFPAHFLGILRVENQTTRFPDGSTHRVTTYVYATAGEGKLEPPDWPPLPTYAGLYGLVETAAAEREYWPMQGLNPQVP